MRRASWPGVFVRAMALARSAVNGRGCTTTGERACSPGSPENGDRMDRPQWRVESARIRNGGMRTWCPRCRLWFSAYYYYHLVHAPFCKEEIHD